MIASWWVFLNKWLCQSVSLWLNPWTQGRFILTHIDIWHCSGWLRDEKDGCRSLHLRFCQAELHSGRFWSQSKMLCARCSEQDALRGLALEGLVAVLVQDKFDREGSRFSLPPSFGRIHDRFSFSTSLVQTQEALRLSLPYKFSDSTWISSRGKEQDDPDRWLVELMLLITDRWRVCHRVRRWAGGRHHRKWFV